LFGQHHDTISRNQGLPQPSAAPTDSLKAVPVKSDTVSYPPRGLSRDEAARYVGVGPTLFDELVADRRMPKPKRINSRMIWDRIELDIAFSELPNNNDSLGALLAASPKVK
jgi:predicted DNA-binding transcriptional regulator AlpA